MKKAAKARGFTLLEMMVVVLIIGIVAAVVTASVGEKPGEARARLTRVAIAKLKGELQLFKADQNRYPETLEDLVRRPAYIDLRNWPEQGYLEEVPLDGWGRRFH